MKTVALGPVTTPGYDVSHYQSNMNIHAMEKAAGKKFCIIKAIQGTTINDSLMHAHMVAAQAAGMIVGFYNFFNPAQSPDLQAKHFLSIVGKLGPGTLGPVCDAEQLVGVAAPKAGQEIFDYMTEICGLVGRPKDGGIYGSPFFIEALALPKETASDFWSWIAAYSEPVTAVKLPDPFTRLTMFQYTDGGSSNIDLNLFNGSTAQLQKMAGM